MTYLICMDGAGRPAIHPPALPTFGAESLRDAWGSVPLNESIELHFGRNKTPLLFAEVVGESKLVLWDRPDQGAVRTGRDTGVQVAGNLDRLRAWGQVRNGGDGGEAETSFTVAAGCLDDGSVSDGYPMFYAEWEAAVRYQVSTSTTRRSSRSASTGSSTPGTSSGCGSTTTSPATWRPPRPTACSSACSSSSAPSRSTDRALPLHARVAAFVASPGAQPGIQPARPANHHRPRTQITAEPPVRAQRGARKARGASANERSPGSATSAVASSATTAS